MAGDIQKVTAYVADTHALFWYLTDNPRLGAAASRAFDEADASAALIYIPAIVLAELYFLNEKLGAPLDFPAEFARLRQSAQFALFPFVPEEVLEFAANAATPEMHDRIIVGAARKLNAACLTKDSKIAASKLVAVIW